MSAVLHLRIAASAALLLAGAAHADIAAPPALRDVAIREHLGGQLPLDVPLTGPDGAPRRLGDFFDGRRPVLLTLFYSRCPMLCGLVLDGAARAMRGAAQRAGDDYLALSLSIDPRETPDSAAVRRRSAQAGFTPALPAAAWPFVVADEPAIRAVADALGFAYRYDAASGQFAHPAALFILTPDGRVSRYIYGFDLSPADLDGALADAAAGRIGADSGPALLLQCFRYLPSLRAHATALRVLLAASGALILVGTLAFIGYASTQRSRSQDVA
jgi:protein SCO1/2